MDVGTAIFAELWLLAILEERGVVTVAFALFLCLEEKSNVVSAGKKESLDSDAVGKEFLTMERDEEERVVDFETNSS